MNRATQRDPVGIRGIIRIRAWDVPSLRESVPSWDDMDSSEKLEVLWDAPVSPVLDGVTENLVTDDYLEALAAGYNPTPTHLALGDDTTDPAGDNEALNNEVYRTGVGQDESEGGDRLTSTLISQNEANGQAIREIGLTNGRRRGEWSLLSHAILDASDQIDEKNSSMTITIDYVLEYRRAG